MNLKCPNCGYVNDQDTQEEEFYILCRNCDERFDKKGGISGSKTNGRD